MKSNYRAHDYQKYATQFIINNKACGLLLDMGLGKTVITLTALWELALDYFDISRVLVIAPLRVAKDTWKRELEKWEHLTGLSYAIAVGNEKQRRDALNKKAFVYITNRENVVWIVENKLFDFDCVVVDELSSFKNHESKRYRALRRVRSRVKRFIGLTGTPAPNSLMDLWAQINLIDMGERLGRYISSYRENFFLPDKQYGHVVYTYKLREGAEDIIYDRISDICVSMKAKDYLKMPECITSNIVVEMSKKERKMYDDLKKDLLLKLEDGDVDASTASGLSNKLLQMANGAVYDEFNNTRIIHERKLKALEQVIEEANGKPVLVAYWFKHDRDRLLDRFNAREIDTEEDIAMWNSGRIPVAIIHPASAGHGLNLQEGGCHIVWFGLTWSLELYQQCNARLYRQGQQRTVVIQHIITKDTIDEDVLEALEHKDMEQEKLLNAVKARIGA